MTAPSPTPPPWLERLAATAGDIRYPLLVAPTAGTGRPGSGGRPAAVLLLFGPHGTAGAGTGGGSGGPTGAGTGAATPAGGSGGAAPVRTDVLLIERARTLRAHAGQPAFPGGALDPGDDGPAGAALREAAEETGLDPAGVRVLATLPPLPVPVSSFLVTPVLAWWERPSAVAPVDAGEVAAVARVPLDELTDPANRLSIRLPGGRSSTAFRAGGLLVWGFTALLLDGVLRHAGLERPWDPDERVEDLPADVLALAHRSAPPVASPAAAPPPTSQRAG